MADDPLDLLKRAPAPAMDLDENAVLSGGRRRQRRRRLAQVLASTLTVAAIALGGWWVASPGSEDSSLPGGPTLSTTVPTLTATSTGPGSIVLPLAIPGTSSPSPEVHVYQDGGVVNLLVATADGLQSQEVGALRSESIGDEGAAVRFQAFARPLVLLLTPREARQVRLLEPGRQDVDGSPWGDLSGRSTGGQLPGTTLWATLIDTSARTDVYAVNAWWVAAGGTGAIASVTEPIPAIIATSSPTKTGAPTDNVLRSGVAEDVTTENEPDLPVATERFNAKVTVAANGSATARVTPTEATDVGAVQIAAGKDGAFVLPGVKDGPSPVAHVYGLVRAGAGELTITAAAGSKPPARWSTSTFPVEGTDVVLVVVTVPVTSGATDRWTVSWQSADGAHTVPVVVPGG